MSQLSVSCAGTSFIPVACIKYLNILVCNFGYNLPILNVEKSVPLRTVFLAVQK